MKSILSNKKVLVGVGVVVIAAAAIIGGTIAYFSDVETSVGNQFKAGKFNLKIDNTCHYNGRVCVCSAPDQCLWSETQEPCFCTWEEKDLEGELFFNFDDIKPGDFGEDTISFHIDNNDAWLCAQIAGLKNYDNGCEQPELIAETAKYGAGNETCGEIGEGEGELQDYLRFTIWRDNGESEFACNNILDSEEEVLVDNQLLQEIIWPIADSTNGTPLEGDKTHCIGVKWNLPLSTSNIIQTDSIIGDVRFVAVQARHMDTFKCAELFTEVCDGIDNDYDGVIDEDWPNLGQVCTVGVGVCQAEGTYMCDANNPAGPSVCSATPGTPGTEICSNQLDDDCDGLVDEDCYSLNVSKTGTGTGTVAGTGINCGSDCSETLLTGTQITLTASPNTDSNFTGWSGACTGTSPTCVVTVGDAPSNVTANFALKTFTLNVYKMGTGSGLVKSFYGSAINCGTDCSEIYNYNELVKIEASADSGYIFGGWGTGCTSEDNYVFAGKTYYTCEFNMTGNKFIDAKFWALHGSLTTVTVYSTADTYVDDANPTTAYGSLTTFSTKLITGTGGNTRYGLVKFDMPSIPWNMTIVQADLRLYIESMISGNTFTDASVITSNWTEAATWNTAPSSTYNDWVFINVSGTGWNTWNVREAVKKFKSGTLTNYGWLMDTGPGTTINFRSHDFSGTTYDPQLVITYGNYY